jgi:hypothetical protein
MVILPFSILPMSLLCDITYSIIPYFFSAVNRSITFFIKKEAKKQQMEMVGILTRGKKTVIIKVVWNVTFEATQKKEDECV